MAERIADPVRRLTRATRRIARGDFDARIAVRSADELRRLVDAFNSMAAELKAQRSAARTHASARGLGGDGAAGRARDQEPADADPALGRAPAARARRPRRAARAGARRLRRRDPRPGAAAAADLRRVLELRVVADRASRRRSIVPELVAEVVDPYRTGLAGRIEIDNRRACAAAAASFVDRTLIARASQHRRERAARDARRRSSPIDASRRGSTSSRSPFDDTGVGMDEEALARVFEPYFSTKTTGTGLGLPIARRNVELSGGTIEVDSGRGRGTDVRSRLPICRMSQLIIASRRSELALDPCVACDSWMLPRSRCSCRSAT